MEDLAQVVQVVVRGPDQEVLLEVSILAVQDPVLGAQQGAWVLDLDQEVQLEAEDHGPGHDRGVQQAVELPDQDQGRQQVVPDREVDHPEAEVDRGHLVNQGLVADQDPVVDLYHQEADLAAGLDHQEADLAAGLDQEVGPGASLDLLPVEKVVSSVFVCTMLTIFYRGLETYSTRRYIIYWVFFQNKCAQMF